MIEPATKNPQGDGPESNIEHHPGLSASRDKTVRLWNKDIRAYKKHLTQKAEKEAAAKKI